MSKNNTKYKPIVLCILDGWGMAPPGPGNAITLAKTPNVDRLWVSNPHGYLHASGSAVGLPHGVNGNSEVGHINIGAGKVIYQELPRIDTAITNQTFFENDILIKTIQHAKNSKGKVHVMGIVSNGNVHGSIRHIFAILRTCSIQGLSGDKVLIHVFTDGRDSNPTSSKMFVEELESEMERLRVGKFASICGRYYAMDRDLRWERTEKAYDLIANGIGEKVNNIYDAIDISHKRGETDEFILPFVVTETNNDVHKVDEGDSIIFSNFRPDRAIQITKAFVLPNFDGFERPLIKNLMFTGVSEYEKNLPMNIAFPPEDVSLPIGRVISNSGLRQLRIAESEKFPHVTYFLNGGREEVFQSEDRVEIPSPKVSTYDLKPEMSSYEVTDEIIKRINMDIYDFIAVNYAAGDMVAHTGKVDATVKAIEVLDECVGKLFKVISSRNGALVIISDHGNAEEIINLHTGDVDTEHSTNPVPFIFATKKVEPRELQFGILADVSPTILSKMGIKKPSSMTGRNLLA